MSRELPNHPNVEHLKKQAKALLREWHETGTRPRAKLAEAQHSLACEYNFPSWPKLIAHVTRLSRGMEAGELLALAVRAQNAEEVARVLERFPELKSRIDEPMAGYGEGMQAMIAAVQRTDRKTIDVLLAAGANINARAQWWAGGISVLDECVPDLAPLLIERGAAVDAHAAARLGMIDKLRELVAADPGLVHARGHNGQTPLHFASTMETAEFLLEHGAEIDARDLMHESTPAQHMLRVVQARHYPHDRQEIARYLVARGCSTDIIMAAALGDLDLARRHLDAEPECVRMRITEQHFPKHEERNGGTIYMAQFGRGRTPHLVARDCGHEAVYQLLMERSPEDVRMAQACDLGDERLFHELLAARPGVVDRLTPEDRRRLPDAAQNNNLAAVKLMLEAGWPVEERGAMELSALDWASWHGNAEMVREILKYGPDLDSRANEHHITALGCALHGSENGWHRDTGDYVATTQALLDAGATAPKVTDDLEASPAVKELLRIREQTALK
jgi:ankyrin repeat protein